MTRDLEALDLDVAAARLVDELEARTARSLAAHRAARRDRKRVPVLQAWLGRVMAWVTR